VKEVALVPRVSALHTVLWFVELGIVQPTGKLFDGACALAPTMRTVVGVVVFDELAQLFG